MGVPCGAVVSQAPWERGRLVLPCCFLRVARVYVGASLVREGSVLPRNSLSLFLRLSQARPITTVITTNAAVESLRDGYWRAV